jgi:RNA polymerase sigma-B factor
MAPHNSRRLDNDDEYQAFEPLFEKLAGLADSDPRRDDVRDRIITGYLPVAEHIARRYSSGGAAGEDLVQVATLGLIHAVDRYDPARGTEFLSFAVPTVMGEVRRYFRDTAWPVRLPRRLQELRLAINAVSAHLAQELGRPATAADLAARLHLPEADVVEGLQAIQAFRAVSLDQPATADASLAELIGADDLAIGLVEDRETLLPLLLKLPDRERHILAMRFFGDRTQSQIGEELGLSQKHISRLIKHTLEELRGRMFSPLETELDD